jgi:hypothetical protein
VFSLCFSSRDKEDKLKSFEEKFSPGKQHSVIRYSYFCVQSLIDVTFYKLKKPCVYSL